MIHYHCNNHFTHDWCPGSWIARPVVFVDRKLRPAESILICDCECHSWNQKPTQPTPTVTHSAKANTLTGKPTDYERIINLLELEHAEEMSCTSHYSPSIEDLLPEPDLWI